MSLKTILARVWARGKSQDSETPYSIVLLLRRPHFFSQAELEAAGTKGWKKRFESKDEDPMYFVVQSGGVTMMKAGTYVINVLHVGRPYLEDVEDVAQHFPRPEQKTAWLEHSAWVAIDMIKLSTDLKRKEAYGVLARFARHLGDENCSGIYLPKDSVFFPNDGTADEGLEIMIRDFSPPEA